MMYKMAISSGRYRNIAYTIGTDDVLSADTKGMVRNWSIS